MYSQQLAQILAELVAINRRLDETNRRLNIIERIQMSTQDDINAAAAAEQADAAQLTTAINDISTAVTAVQAEIAALQTQNPTVDTSALIAANNALAQAFGGLSGAVSGVQGLEPPAPPASN